MSRLRYGKLKRIALATDDDVSIDGGFNCNSIITSAGNIDTRIAFLTDNSDPAAVDSLAEAITEYGNLHNSQKAYIDSADGVITDNLNAEIVNRQTQDNLKRNISDSYNQTEINDKDNIIIDNLNAEIVNRQNDDNLKRNISDSYNQTEINNLFDDYTTTTAINTKNTSQDNAITSNLTKFDDYTTTTDINTKNTSQDNAIATKQSTLDGTHLHLHSNGSFVGIGTTPDYHLHIKDSGDPSVKIERASNNYLMLNETHFMIVKPSGAQFDFNLQGYNNDMCFKTNNIERLRLEAQGNIKLSGDTTISGDDIRFTGSLPTTAPLQSGRIYVLNNALYIVP